MAAVLTDPLVTVVVVNYNGAHLLGPCLSALRAQTLPAAAFHTWVVDNASSDGSRELVARQFPEVRLIASPVNAGFAGGNNLALRQVRTPYAALLNTDTVADPGWLEGLVGPLLEPDGGSLVAVTSKVVLMPRFARLPFRTEGFRPGGADPRELGVRVLEATVDGRPVLDEIAWERASYGPEQNGGQRFYWTRPAGEALVPVGDAPAGARLELTWVAERRKPVVVQDETYQVSPEPARVTIPLGPPWVDVVNNAGGIVFADGYGADRGYQQVDSGQFDEPAEVFTACGAAMALRTAAARRAGWFDDDFFLYYEDTDLGWRLRSAGGAIRYEPKALVRHHHSATSREFSPSWHFHVDRNRLLMLTKNATPALAAGQLARYCLTTGSMGVRAVRRRDRAGLARVRQRLRVLASYARLLPRMLAARRAIGRAAVASRRALEERWLVAR